MEPRESQRDTYNGFGDSLARAFELAVTPAIFGALGYWLDGKFGIRPVLMITLSLVTLITMGIRTIVGYDQQMRRHDAEGAWSKGRTPFEGREAAVSERQRANRQTPRPGHGATRGMPRVEP